MAPATGRDARRLTSAFTLVLAAALVASLAALVSPTFRHQLAVSLSRQQSGYVELYLTDEASARSCTAANGRLPVSATLRSHLDEAQELTYTMTVVSSIGVTKDRVTGTLATRPGAATVFAAPLIVPTRRGYTVSVTLAGRTEHLRLHCAAPRART